MTYDHDEWDCPEWLNCIQLVKNAIATEQTSEGQNVKIENLVAYFLEYESDSERGGTMFTTLQNSTCTVMTRGQRNQKPYPGNSSNTPTSKGKEPIHTDSTKFIEPRILT